MLPTISVPQSLLRTLMEDLGYEHDIEQVNEELPVAWNRHRRLH